MRTSPFYVIIACFCAICLTSCGEKTPVTPPDPPVPHEKYEIVLSESELSMEATDPASQSVDVTTEARKWDVSTEEGWLTAVKNGNAVTISAEDNPDTESRTGYVTIDGEDVKAPVEIEVSQAGIELRVNLSVSAESLTFLNTDDASDPQEVFVTCDRDIWQARLESDEYFTLVVDGNKLTVAPKSINESEDDRVTTLTVEAGTAAEPVEVIITQEGTTPVTTPTFESFSGEWKIAATPDPYGKPGATSWNSPFVPETTADGRWYISWNFGGYEDTYLPLKYTEDGSFVIDDFSAASLPLGGNQRAYIRTIYFDDRGNSWYAMQPVTGTWDGVSTTITFSGQVWSIIDQKMHDIAVIAIVFNEMTGNKVGDYTDSYTKLVFSRDAISSGNAGYPQYSSPEFPDPDETARLKSLREVSEKMNGGMARVELTSERIR